MSHSIKNLVAGRRPIKNELENLILDIQIDPRGSNVYLFFEAQELLPWIKAQDEHEQAQVIQVAQTDLSIIVLDIWHLGEQKFVYLFPRKKYFAIETWVKRKRFAQVQDTGFPESSARGEFLSKLKEENLQIPFIICS